MLPKILMNSHAMIFSTHHTRKYRVPWKQSALLLTLLTGTVLGSPVIPSADFSVAISSQNQSVSGLENTLLKGGLDSSSERTDRKKRFLGDAVKKAKQAKLLTIGAASGNVVKKVTKSAVKSIISFGIKAIILNFLYKKINQVLDFKTRALNNLEHRNRGQNPQNGTRLEGSRPANSSTSPNPSEEIPEFNADKVSLQVPDAVFGQSFSIANGASQVLGTLIQNTALRISRLFEALKPLLTSSSSFKSKKRQTDFDTDDNDEFEPSVEQPNNKYEKSPIKNSYAALTQRR